MIGFSRTQDPKWEQKNPLQTLDFIWSLLFMKLQPWDTGDESGGRFKSRSWRRRLKTPKGSRIDGRITSGLPHRTEVDSVEWIGTVPLVYGPWGGPVWEPPERHLGCTTNLGGWGRKRVPRLKVRPEAYRQRCWSAIRDASGLTQGSFFSFVYTVDRTLINNGCLFVSLSLSKDD